MTGAIATRAFDVCGPLPTGVTVLEASAGTGKTYTIAALAARYVAEGTPLDRLLLVTFTRMATGELRERVRSRLVGVELGLERALAGVGAPGDRRSRRSARPGHAGRGRPPVPAPAPGAGRLRRGDHRHHPRLLPGGARRPGDRRRPRAGRRFVEDVAELIDEVVDDLYVRALPRRRGASPSRGPRRPRSPAS